MRNSLTRLTLLTLAGVGFAVLAHASPRTSNLDTTAKIALDDPRPVQHPTPAPGPHHRPHHRPHPGPHHRPAPAPAPVPPH